MFDINEYGERVFRFGCKTYVVPEDQREIHQSRRWSVHLRKKSTNGYINYCLYFWCDDDSQKGVWHLGIKSGIFARSNDFVYLREKSPETLAWLLRVINGERNEPPFPNGIPSNVKKEKREKFSKKVVAKKSNGSSRPLTAKEILKKKMWQAFPGILKALREMPFGGSISDRSVKEKFGIGADEVRDLIDLLRISDNLIFTPKGAILRDVSDEYIMNQMYKSGATRGAKGVDWINQLRLKYGH